MTKRSKYATLDAVVVDEIRRAGSRGVYGPHGNSRIRAFAFDHEGGYKIISRRLQALRNRGVLKNNGVSGDGCRWYAAP